MAAELNKPNHRYYQLRNHIKLPEIDMSKQWIYADGVRKIDSFMISPLFAAAEPGVWYDPSDLTTLFQDNAGTTPVTAAGQTVGKMLDKSGRGNHVTQATLAQRPTYGINPIVGTRNLLTRTEQFDNAAWILGTSGGALAKGTVSTDRPDATSGSVSTLSFPTVSAGGFSFAYQVLSATYLNTPVTFSIWMRVASGSGTVYLNAEDAGAAPSGGNFFASPALSLTTTWQRFTLSGTRTSVTGNLVAAIGFDTRSAAGQANASPLTVQVWGAQLELGSTATAYQKVVTQYEVTQAGVQSTSYLAFDGVDDGMVTPTITPAIDKVQVFAGVRKLSDAAQGMVVETSSNASSSAGSFHLQAPGVSGQASYRFASGGTVRLLLDTPATYPAPITNVVTGLNDIAVSSTTIRVNGVLSINSSASQGTGNYLAYPLYIGRRGGTTLPFNGRIYSLITRFGANLTTGQITSTESWVNAKTGAY